GAVDPLLAL
nr:Chain C, PEPTIDE FROM IMPORTIN ALPHA-2 [synthetic construct]